MSAGIDSVLQGGRRRGSRAPGGGDGGRHGRADLRGRGRPAGGGRERPGDARHACSGSLSMTKMVAPSRRCSRSSAATSTSTRRSSSTGPSSPTCRCSRASTATRRSCARRRRKATVRQLVTPHERLATGSGTPTSCAGRRSPARRTCSSGDERHLHRAARRRPRHEVRVRHQHRLARARRRGGERADARRLHRRAHPRPAGDDQHGVPDDAEQRANSVPVHLRGEDGAWEPSDVDWSPGARTGGPAATACTRRRATT